MSFRTFRAGLRATTRTTRPTLARPPARIAPARRGIASGPITALADVILASPVPYGATIVALTLTVRSAISLPAALWTRKRTRRLREVVMPEMKRENDRLALEVFKECRAKGVGPDEYMVELKKRVKDAQFALHRKYNTHPMFTLAVPFLTNIPILVVTSLAIRQAVDTPASALVGQSLLWISDISVPDPQGLIGLLAGCLAFASSEIHGARRRRLEAETKAAASPDVPPVEELTPPPKPEAPRTASKLATPPRLPSHLRRFSTTSPAAAVRPMRRPTNKKKPMPVPYSRVLEDVDTVPGGRQTVKNTTSAFQTVMEYGVKAWSVGIIAMALSQPAALVFYWVCSISYTLVQNLVFARIDEREDRARRLLKAAGVSQRQQMVNNAAAASNPPGPM